MTATIRRLDPGISLFTRFSSFMDTSYDGGEGVSLSQQEADAGCQKWENRLNQIM
jgi:hypothetical protein